MGKAKKYPVSLKRFNVWRFYCPPSKQELLREFWRLAEERGLSRSEATLMAIQALMQVWQEQEAEAEGER